MLCFFANDLLLAVYILDYGNDVSQKANFFRLSSKWVIKQQKWLTTSTHLTQELITNIQCSGASRSFATEMRALKIEEHSGLPLEGDKDQLRGSSKLILLKLQKVLLKNSMLTIQHLKQIGKVKTRDRWGASWADCKSKKKNHFEVWSSHFVQQQWTISQLDCDVRQKVDFIWQSAVTSSVVESRRSCKALPKAKLATQKRSWSLVICCWILVI